MKIKILVGNSHFSKRFCFLSRTFREQIKRSNLFCFEYMRRTHFSSASNVQPATAVQPRPWTVLSGTKKFFTPSSLFKLDNCNIKSRLLNIELYFEILLDFFPVRDGSRRSLRFSHFGGRETGAYAKRLSRRRACAFEKKRTTNSEQCFMRELGQLRVCRSSKKGWFSRRDDDGCRRRVANSC